MIFSPKRHFYTICGASKIGAILQGRTLTHTPTLLKCLYAFRECSRPSRTCFRCQFHNGAKIEVKKSDFCDFFNKKRYFYTICGASKIGANSPGRSMRHTPTLGKCLYAFRERFWPSRTCFRCQLHNGAKIQAKNVQCFFHFRKNTLFLEEFGAISSKLLYMVFKCLKIISPRFQLSGDSFWWSEDLLQTF